MTTTAPFRAFRVAVLVCAMLALWPTIPIAAPATGAAEPIDAPVPPGTPVKVERVRPKQPSHPTLRFLKENRDFIRGLYDQLSQVPDRSRGQADALDPRFLEYDRMLARSRSTQDSLLAADQAAERHELFASVSDLTRLESQLDAMDHALVEQQVRLATLQRDFAGRQRTTLSVLLTGTAEKPVSEIVLAFDDGSRRSVPLSAEQQRALLGGGILELFHGLVEPRAQVIEVGLRGSGWSASDSGFVSLELARDRMTFLRIDLAAARPAEGAPSATASTWVLEDRPTTMGRPE